MTYTLEPLTAPDWPALTRQQDHWRGWTWIWADLGGIQLADRPPPHPPVTTCLWGWQIDTWARIRLDPTPGRGLTVIGALLTRGGTTGTPVDPVVSLVPSFTSSSSRGPGLQRLQRTDLRTLDVPVPALTFVELA